jgi:argininosuccinate lyase
VIYAQNSRGKIEAAIVQALTQIMLDLSKFAQDVLLFTTVEYGFLLVSQEICVGSSIMPQKRNLGVMELVRARTQTMLAMQQQILGIITGLPSGFNMDYQETKRPFFEALELVQESLDICEVVISNVKVNTERVIAACTFELFAADRAYELEQLVARLHARSHLGGAGNPGFELSVQRLHEREQIWRQRAEKFTQAIEQLVGSKTNIVLEEV